jgi:hypothetical protein
LVYASTLGWKLIEEARIGRRAYNRAYRLKNQDRLRAYDRDHLPKNRDKKRTYLKAYRRKNQDKRRAYNRNLFEQWVALRAPQADSERIGKEWLLNNGFQYVYMFADYLNGTEKDTYRRRFPFDYYAEKNGERWFVDATVGSNKRVDVNVSRVFLRFARIGILFVGKERSYLIEKRRPEPRNLSLKPSTIRAIRGVKESSSDGCG